MLVLLESTCFLAGCGTGCCSQLPLGLAWLSKDQKASRSPKVICHPSKAHDLDILNSLEVILNEELFCFLQDLVCMNLLPCFCTNSYPFFWQKIILFSFINMSVESLRDHACLTTFYLGIANLIQKSNKGSAALTGKPIRALEVSQLNRQCTR
jgi:hypothetical protein